MAAIDRLYVHSYDEYVDLQKWAIVYYPELLFYFYDYMLTFQQYMVNRTNWINEQSDIAIKEYERKIDGVVSKEAAILRIRNIHGYDNYSYVQAAEEYDTIIRNYRRTIDEWEDMYTFPIMNAPRKIDKKLLWICPIPFVREYLENQCGYKTKWYHKLFWKGKKYFL